MSGSEFALRTRTRPSPCKIIAACVLVALLGTDFAWAQSAHRCRNFSISGSPTPSVVAGQAYAFTPSVSGWHQGLQFSIANKPAWASFSTSTGTLSGTPSTSNEGSFSNITISAVTACSNSSLAPFSIQVTAPASPPTISGTPASAVTAGSAYSFQPTASDPDGDALSFSVQNKPAWASFSGTSGTLSGTPTSTDVGTYSNIIISVSDGTSSVSLAPFSISVNSSTTTATTGTANLTWTAPTTNTDGTPITNLAGYYVYYGTSASSLSQMVQVAGATMTTCSIAQLASGTWYFAVTAYLSDGTQSAPSNVVSATLP